MPAPQAQTSSSSPSSTPGDSPASSSPQSPQDSIHLPPPPPPGHAGAYQTVKRKGTVGPEELENNLATLGGRPRSVEGMPAELRGARRRRHLDVIEIDPVSFKNSNAIKNLNNLLSVFDDSTHMQSLNAIISYLFFI